MTCEVSVLVPCFNEEEAIVNFNTPDHPAGEGAYPVKFSTVLAACTHRCTGAVAVDGVSCGPQSANLNLSVTDKKSFTDDESGTESTGITVGVSNGEVKTCTCDANANFFQGDCACKLGFEMAGNVCVPSP